MQFFYFVATAILPCTLALVFPDSVPVHKRQDIAAGTPLYECHADCGYAIQISQEDSDYCSNSTFVSDLSGCLECANTQGIWQYYGTDVAAAAEACGDNSTPSPSSAATTAASTSASPSSAESTTANPSSVESTAAPTTASSAAVSSAASTAAATASTASTFAVSSSSATASGESVSSAVSKSSAAVLSTSTAAAASSVSGVPSVSSNSTSTSSSAPVQVTGAASYSYGVGWSILIVAPGVAYLAQLLN